MFVLNDDMSIYVTRGDIVFFSVSATNEHGENYTFKPDDVVRFKAFEKKACDKVVVQKDFVVTAETEEVSILLAEEDTKFGKVISKPRDYWYEVELNPFTNPQTIIGYDDDGPKVFRLFPEGKDILDDVPEEDLATVDAELSMTSTRPVQNQAVTRGFANLSKNIDEKLKESQNVVNETMQETEERMTNVERRMTDVEVFSQTEALIEHVNAKNNPHGVTAAQVGALPIGGGTLNGYLNVLNTLYVNRTINEILYKSAMMPSGYVVGGENATALSHYIGDSQKAMFLINANGLAFREMVNNKQYAIYGEHNKDSMPFLPLTGGGLSGELSVSNRVAHILGYGDATTRFAQFGVSYANGQRSHMLNLDTFGNVLINCYDESGNWEHDKMMYHTDNITAGTTDLTAGTSALTTGHIYEQYE